MVLTPDLFIDTPPQAVPNSGVRITSKTASPFVVTRTERSLSRHMLRVQRTLLVPIFRPLHYNYFPCFFTTCDFEKLELVDQNQLERDSSALLLRALVVGRRQQCESVGDAITM